MNNNECITGTNGWKILRSCHFVRVLDIENDKKKNSKGIGAIQHISMIKFISLHEYIS